MRCHRCRNKICDSEVGDSLRCIWCQEDFCSDCSQNEKKVERCGDCEQLHKPEGRCTTDHTKCACVCRGRDKWHEHGSPAKSIAEAGLTGLNWYGLSAHCQCKCYSEHFWSGGSSDYAKVFGFPAKEPWAVADCQAAVRRAESHQDCRCECKGNHQLHYTQCLCVCKCTDCGKRCNCSEKLCTMVACGECLGTYIPPKDLRNFILEQADLTETQLLRLAMRKAGFSTQQEAAAAYHDKNTAKFQALPEGYEVSEPAAKRQRVD